MATKGFTQQQKDWFYRVYGHNCQFPEYTEERGFQPCNATDKLQVHHVVPKGYDAQVNQHDPNNARNGIPLCEQHHIGKGHQGSLDWRNEVVPVIHPDTEWARRNYHGTVAKPTTYQTVAEGRQERVANGQTYWNTDWQPALEQIVEDAVGNYTTQHPQDPFPKVKGRKP